MLDGFINEKRSEIRAFLSDSQLRMLCICRDPEAEKMLIKMLQSIEQEESDPLDIFFGFDHEFNDVESFYQGAAEKIKENIREAEPELVNSGLQLTFPVGMAYENGAVEARFASYLDKLCSALQGYVGHIVLCFSPKEINDGAKLRDSLNMTLDLNTSTLIKIIFTDNRKAPQIASLKEEREDAAILEFHFAPEDIESELKEELASGTLSPIEEIRVLTMLAGFSLSRKEFEIAIDTFTKVLTLARKTDIPQEEPMALFHLGNTYYRKEDYMNARENYEESLKISLEQDIQGLILQNLINIGNTFLKENSPEEALLNYGAAWTFSRSVANKFGECQALDCMGQANQMNGNLSQAEENWIGALKIYRAMDPSLRDTAVYGEKQEFERLAELYEEMGEHEQAEECRNEAQKLTPGEPSAK